MAEAGSNMAPFELLSGFPKSTSGEVVAMEWSPTMDLIAIATSDSQVAVVRTGWQRLFAIPAAQPIHCLAWRPDGQELMVGHADGSVALYNIEDGELLWIAEQAMRASQAPVPDGGEEMMEHWTSPCAICGGLQGGRSPPKSPPSAATV